MTTQTIEQLVTSSLAELAPDAPEVARDSTFAELDVDSLDLAELAQVVEDETGVRLEGKDLKGITTVGQVIDLIAERAA